MNAFLSKVRGKRARAGADAAAGRRAGVGLCVLIAAMLVSACSRAYRADPDIAARLSKLAYPEQAPRGEAIDVVVRRRGNTLELNNRTARAYPRVQLWLNQQWVGQLEGIPIGASSASLDHFVNRHGESYPVGALLTPEKALRLVAAEMIDPTDGARRSLTVHVDRN